MQVFFTGLTRNGIVPAVAGSEGALGLVLQDIVTGEPLCAPVGSDEFFLEYFRAVLMMAACDSVDFNALSYYVVAAQRNVLEEYRERVDSLVPPETRLAILQDVLPSAVTIDAALGYLMEHGRLVNPETLIYEKHQGLLEGSDAVTQMTIRYFTYLMNADGKCHPVVMNGFSEVYEQKLQEICSEPTMFATGVAAAYINRTQDMLVTNLQMLLDAVEAIHRHLNFVWQAKVAAQKSWFKKERPDPTFRYQQFIYNASDALRESLEKLKEHALSAGHRPILYKFIHENLARFCKQTEVLQANLGCLADAYADGDERKEQCQLLMDAIGRLLNCFDTMVRYYLPGAYKERID